jgi:hypothetical protein
MAKKNILVKQRILLYKINLERKVTFCKLDYHVVLFDAT